MALDSALPPALMLAAIKLLAVGMVALTAIDIHYRRKHKEGGRYGR